MMHEVKNYNEIVGAIAEAMFVCNDSILKIRIKHSDTIDGVATPLDDKHDLHFDIDIENKFEEKELEKVLIKLIELDCYEYEAHSYELLVVDKA